MEVKRKENRRGEIHPCPHSGYKPPLASTPLGPFPFSESSLSWSSSPPSPAERGEPPVPFSFPESFLCFQKQSTFVASATIVPYRSRCLLLVLRFKERGKGKGKGKGKGAEERRMEVKGKDLSLAKPASGGRP